MVGSIDLDMGWSKSDNPVIEEFLQAYTVEAVATYTQEEIKKYNFSDEITLLI